MIISLKDKAMFYDDVLSIIEQMGSDVVLRTHRTDSDYTDYQLRTVNYNLSTNSTKAMNMFFNAPGISLETGWVYIANYKDLGFIPKEKDLILIPDIGTYGIKIPLKIKDAFEIGEITPIVIDNILLFLYMHCSRAEINVWS